MAKKEKIAVLLFDSAGSYDLDLAHIPELPALVVLGADENEVYKLAEKNGTKTYQVNSMKKMLEEEGLQVIRVPKRNTALYSLLGDVR
jgi:hypothetical protein